MMTAALQWSDIRLPVLIALAAAVGLYLWYLERRTKKTNADKLTERYKVMTPALLEETPDSELVKAVVANVMAAQDSQNRSRITRCRCSPPAARRSIPCG